MTFPLFFVVEFSVVLVFEGLLQFYKGCKFLTKLVLRRWESIAGNLVLTTELKT